VCFPCATTPDRNEQTVGRYAALLDAAEAISPSGMVAIGEPTGPRPVEQTEFDGRLPDRRIPAIDEAVKSAISRGEPPGPALRAAIAEHKRDYGKASGLRGDNANGS
jgi:hypothetical protein